MAGIITYLSRVTRYASRTIMQSDFSQFLISDPVMKGIKKPSVSMEKTEDFLPAERFQERGMVGNTGFSGICSGPKPLAMMDDGQIFEYSREYGTRKLEQ